MDWTVYLADGVVAISGTDVVTLSYDGNLEVVDSSFTVASCERRTALTTVAECIILATHTVHTRIRRTVKYLCTHAVCQHTVSQKMHHFNSAITLSN